MPVFAKGEIENLSLADWMNKYHPMLVHAKKIVVLGCGSGVHLTEILNQFPHMVIEVLEFQAELFEAWKKNDRRGENSQQVGLVSEKTASRKCLVLDFKPAWGAHAIDYALISATLRDVELGTIKDICRNISISNQGQEAKIWRALRELVR